LKETHVHLENNVLALLQPEDVDAVIEWYIEQGTFRAPSISTHIRTLETVLLGLNREHVTLRAIIEDYAGLEDRDPYWAVPWASGVALANYILQNPELVKGKCVADVGCGLGVVGIACALAGMLSIRFSCRGAMCLDASAKT
jgi:hypothetical protein